MLPINYAHRGASSLAPENTIASFKKAIEIGVDGIELDVHLSKDNELIVMHDETVDRLSDKTGYIKDLTIKQIKQLDVGTGFSEEYAGERIPTLEEVFELLKNTNILLNIEIKSNLVLYKGIESRIIETIRQYNYQSKTIISSFNHYSLLDCKKIDSEIETGILYSAGQVSPWTYAASVGAEAIHPFYINMLHFTESHLTPLRESGIKTNVWTPNNEEDMRELIKRGVSGIITDRPQILKKIKDELSGTQNTTQTV